MGIRHVTIYTCDGCRASATLPRDEKVRGFTSVKVPAHQRDIGEKLLCTLCYSAVEWVVKFQGIMVPPKVHEGVDGKFRLRKQSLEDFPQSEPEPDDDDIDLFDEEDE